MSKELSLLDQARIKKRENELKSKIQVTSDMLGSDMLKILLPNYDQQVKPVNFHNATQKQKGIRGGVRSGKTYTLGAEAIRVSYLNRPLYHLSVSPSFDLATVTVIPVLQELCDQNNLQYDWQKSNNLFSIIHGTQKKDIARILIFGADSVFKGITAGSGDLNEPFSIPKDKYLVWWERISDPKSKYLLRMWGGTAEPEKMTWGHEFYKMKSNKKIYLDTFTTYDNKFLAREYIHSLEDKYDPRMRRVYMLGECQNLSATKTYYGFDSQVNVPKYESVLHQIQSRLLQNLVVLSFDFNVSPMCATEHWVNGQEIFQVDEYKILSSNTRELAELVVFRIMQRYQLDRTSFIITGDASGKKGDTRSQDRTYNDYTIIKEVLDQHPEINYTFRVPDKNPFVADSVKHTNNQFYKKVSHICDNCIDTIEDLELVAWKQGAEGFHLDKNKKNAKGETITHLSDTKRYADWILKPYQTQTETGIGNVYAWSSDRW